MVVVEITLEPADNCSDIPTVFSPIKNNGRELTVLPNPGHDNFNWYLPLNVTGDGIISVYNATGTLVISRQINTNYGIIETGNLNAGIYCIRIAGKEGSYFAKVIKQ